MVPKLELLKKSDYNGSSVYLIDDISQLDALDVLNAAEIAYFKDKLKKTGECAWLTQPEGLKAVVLTGSNIEPYELEKTRIAACIIYNGLQKEKIDTFLLHGTSGSEFISAFAEGLCLSNYQFLKYKTDTHSSYFLRKILVNHPAIKRKDLTELSNLLKAVYLCRDLVNEPVIYLTAKQLGAEIEKLGKECDIEVEVLGKSKIQALKMGGLLAVNKGAPNPPTFTIMEYKPAKAINKNPVVLIGKGVVYDTGGLSLKPTPNSMDSMKCDMAGAAAIACAIYASALNKLPIHLIGLIPATENRPDGNALTPGDVITMMSGKTVEVLNTDAEGRLILADALHYAKRYKPELVIDVATLTGAAARAIGKEGIVFMGTADAHIKNEFEQAGYAVHERLVEFPLWSEYESYLKSQVADVKNIGGADAGAITAGIFLKYFTDYEWLHFDIAGPAFLDNNDHYRPKGGTGVGVRLIYQFLKSRANKAASE